MMVKLELVEKPVVKEAPPKAKSGKENVKNKDTQKK